ncbi:MAG: pseudouridine synthase [Bdellovibrionia bacterium]
MAKLNNIIHVDDDIVVIDKPPGYHVHPPEQQDAYPVPREKILLYRLRDHFKKYIYPVHRLDVATSGLLVYAFSSEAAGALSQQWSEKVAKKYWVIARGHFSEPEFTVEIPLLSDSSQEMLPCKTHFKRLRQIELPYAVGKKFKTAQYSWLEAELHSGRFHQIRRHLNRISHPVIGDGAHGDSHHNRFFRETLGIPGLCLRSQELSFPHPRTSEKMSFVAPPSEKWLKIHNLFTDFDAYLKQL